MVADLVPPERHESAYASVRVASNLGVVCGPVIGGLLLIGRHWAVLFVGVFVMSIGAFAIGWRYLPRRGAYAPEEPPTRGSFGVIRRDQAFLVFLLSSALAYLVYVAVETVLPVAAVNGHGIEPSTWGFIVIINPLLVTLFQLRITRRTTWFAPGPKLVTAMLMMGCSFLLLLVAGSAATFAIVITIFVIGEMLWVPTSQAIAAGLAPEDIRGAYMGAFGATGGVGFALGPVVAFGLQDRAGEGAGWVFFAAISVVAAITGAAAVRVGAGAAPRRAAALGRRMTGRLGAIPRPGGTVEFRVWAPARASVAVRIGGETHDLARDGETFARTLRAAPGDDYTFVLDGTRGAARSVLALPARGDPRAFARGRDPARRQARALARRARRSTSSTSGRSRRRGRSTP